MMKYVLLLMMLFSISCSYKPKHKVGDCLYMNGDEFSQNLSFVKIKIMRIGKENYGYCYTTEHYSCFYDRLHPMDFEFIDTHFTQAECK